MFIYKIKNIKNSKIYVGLTMRKKVEIRWQHHKSNLRNNKHPNKHLQSAWNKYGEDSFAFEIIEQVNPEMNFDINNLERYWIKHYDSTNPTNGYNKTFGGECGFPTEETRKKISDSLKGKPLSDAHKINIGKAQSDKKRAASARCKRIVCLNNKNEYSSIREAARILNLNPGHISMVCLKKAKHTKGFKFDFCTEAF